VHSRVARGLTVLALVVLTSAVAHADAISDQKKAYKAMGVPIPDKSAPPMCNLLTKDEAARYLGKPVGDCGSAGPNPGCGYGAVDGSKAGILVTRTPRSDWDLKYIQGDKHYRAVHDLGEQAYTMEETVGDHRVGYSAGVLGPNGVTEVTLVGQYDESTALAVVRLVMKR
jgi:hypothetical protein